MAWEVWASKNAYKKHAGDQLMLVTGICCGIVVCMFIVLDGPDGSGTTRQADLLAQYLQKNGYDVLLTAEPSTSAPGMKARELISSGADVPAEEIQQLFCDDRREHLSTVIQPALDKGMIVVCDRYVLSTLVYGSVAGVPREKLIAMNADFPDPDLTILTLPPFDVCLERIGRRETTDSFEKREFQEKVHQLYSEIDDSDVLQVDTSGTREESAAIIWRSVSERLQ